MLFIMGHHRSPSEGIIEIRDDHLIVGEHSVGHLMALIIFRIVFVADGKEGFRLVFFVLA